MEKKLGKEVNISSEVDATLIAGAIIRAGDLVIDGSVLARLNKLSTALNK
jgi:F-type H+-transporting ATPase subunit delta